MIYKYNDYENQSKNIQKKDSEKPAAQPKDIVDTAMQTESKEKRGIFKRSEGFCQTESSERNDFQVQVHLQKQGETIATQTDSATLSDFQVQANIPKNSDSIATQTIKEEIRMPNTPSSAAQIPAKKRKLSSVSTPSVVSPNVSPQPLPNSSGDQLSNNQAVIESVDSSIPKTVSNRNGDQSNNGRIVLDDAILNSEVYQIYCRNEDPKEAMEQIRQLKSFVDCWEPTKPFPTEEDFKHACETALDRLWNLEPHLGDSKFDKIKKYVNSNITLDQLTNSDDKICIKTLFKDREYFTAIRLLNPKGYEFFFISNFEQGLRKSKWYLGRSSRVYRDCKLATLKILGIDNATIAKLQFDHYLTKNSTEIKWFDFANDHLRYGKGMLSHILFIFNFDKL